MTIRKGLSWGDPGPLAKNSSVVDGDRALSRTLEEQLAQESITNPGDAEPSGLDVPEFGLDVPEFGLLGGDLHKSVGAPGHSAADLFEGRGVRLPIDIGVVEFEEGGIEVRRLFVAHMVARVGRTGGLWAGRTAVVMNGSFIGAANLGPKAHPNDGRLDVVDGKLGMSDRRKARQRMATGTHVPHPSLVELRVRKLVLSDDKAFSVRVDGELVGSATELKIRCIPDAAIIVV